MNASAVTIRGRSRNATPARFERSCPSSAHTKGRAKRPPSAGVMRRGVLAVPTSALRIALFVLLLCARTAAADDPNALAGTWNGVLVKDGDPLAVTMSFSRSGTRWTGTFGSDAQQAAGIPLSRITATGSAIHFELRGDDGTTVFDGTVRRDGASGTFTDGSSKGA